MMFTIPQKIFLLALSGVVAFGLLGAAPAAQAGPILVGTYTFDNTDGTNNAPADKSASNVAAGLTFNDFFSNGVVGEGIGGKGADNANTLATRDWPSTFNDNDYWAFSALADTSGDAIQLDQLSFRYHIRNSSDPRDGQLQIWEIGGSEALDTITLFTDIGSLNADPLDWTDPDGIDNVDATSPTIFVDLSSYTLDTTGLEFRFQFGDHNDPDGGFGLARIHDVEITAIPEPASLALMGLGTLILLGRRPRSSDAA